MNTYKLIVLDLDGTLLCDNKEVSAVNQEWIKKAETAGLVVSFATGRSKELSERYWGLVSPDSPMIMVNGAEVWLNHFEILVRQVLPADCIPRLHELGVRHNLSCWGHTTQGYVSQEEWATRFPLRRDWLKITMASDDIEIVQKIRRMGVGMDFLEVTSSEDNNIEFTKKGVSKATGLALLADLLQIAPSEVVAIGDNFNDYKMLEWAGLGIAMGNAENSIKVLADYVTATNENDGVADAIRLVLNNGKSKKLKR